MAVIRIAEAQSGDFGVLTQEGITKPGPFDMNTLRGSSPVGRNVDPESLSKEFGDAVINAVRKNSADIGQPAVAKPAVKPQGFNA